MKKLVRKIEEIVNNPAHMGVTADNYRVMIDGPRMILRVVFVDKAGTPIAHHDFASADAYTFASRILAGYDRLEGIK